MDQDEDLARLGCFCFWTEGESATVFTRVSWVVKLETLFLVLSLAPSGFLISDCTSAETTVWFFLELSLFGFGRWLGLDFSFGVYLIFSHISRLSSSVSLEHLFLDTSLFLSLRKVQPSVFSFRVFSLFICSVTMKITQVKTSMVYSYSHFIYFRCAIWRIFDSQNILLITKILWNFGTQNPSKWANWISSFTSYPVLVNKVETRCTTDIAHPEIPCLWKLFENNRNSAMDERLSLDSQCTPQARFLDKSTYIILVSPPYGKLLKLLTLSLKGRWHNQLNVKREIFELLLIKPLEWFLSVINFWTDLLCLCNELSICTFQYIHDLPTFVSFCSLYWRFSTLIMMLCSRCSHLQQKFDNVQMPSATRHM